jgi:hypothetical protein
LYGLSNYYANYQAGGGFRSVLLSAPCGSLDTPEKIEPAAGRPVGGFFVTKFSD